MDASELVKGEMYYSEFVGRNVEYCGTETYQDEIHYNFFDSTTKLFHWLNPSDVKQNSPLSK